MVITNTEFHSMTLQTTKKWVTVTASVGWTDTDQPSRSLML
jgi:hypothetical protein